jgi:iron complex transport system substrate-binding protein
MGWKLKNMAKFMLVIILAVSLVACGQNTQPASAPDKDSQPVERTVVDMADRTVTLPAEIESIATFGAVGVINTFVELMGEGSKICNEMPPRFTKTNQWKYQYEFAPQLKEKPLFQDPNDEILMEVVLKNKPDLCIAMDKTIVDSLEKQGLNVIYLSWSQLEDVKTCITLLGDALNKQEVAADYIQYFDGMVAKAQELTKDMPKEQRKKVLYGSVTELTQPHVIAEWWITQAGGNSVTDDGRTANRLVYTLEDLLAWNPEVIILSNIAKKEEILADKRIAEVSAIKNNEIYGTPTVAHVWGNRTVEQPLTIMWTIHKLYPEIVSYEMLAEDIHYFYNHFFHYDLSEEQLAEIIG